jgi:uncharacterized damage-inducible protein DinB
VGDDFLHIHNSGPEELLKTANGTLYLRWNVATVIGQGRNHDTLSSETLMDSYLDELFAHQQWADAKHWRAFEACPEALADKALYERLFHIHLVQHAFLWITGPRLSQFDYKKLEEFREPAILKSYAQQGVADLAERLKNTTPDTLEEIIEIVWFNPPLKISRRHALMQAAMHSHYHRGQNATRLRELGGVPPGTDFIEWLRDGKPLAQWS